MSHYLYKINNMKLYISIRRLNFYNKFDFMNQINLFVNEGYLQKISQWKTNT